MHTLLNVLKHGGSTSRDLGISGPDEAVINAISPEGVEALEAITELSYCAQIVIRLFEVRMFVCVCVCVCFFLPHTN